MLRVALAQSLKNHKKHSANADDDENADGVAGSVKDRRKMPLRGQTLDTAKMERMLDFKRKQRANYATIPFAIAFFAATVSVIMFHAEVETSFQLESALVDYFVDPENVGVVTDYTPIAFSSVGSHEDAFDWLENTLLPQIMVQSNYIGETLDEDEWGYTMSHNRIIGAARVMVKQVEAEGCRLSEYDDFYGSCWPEDGTDISWYATDADTSTSETPTGSTDGPPASSGSTDAPAGSTDGPPAERAALRGYRFLRANDAGDRTVRVWSDESVRGRRLEDPPPSGPPSDPVNVTSSASSGSGSGSAAASASAASASAAASAASASGSAADDDNNDDNAGPPAATDDDDTPVADDDTTADPTVAVQGTMVISGYAASDFASTERDAFRQAVANSAEVDMSVVSISSVTDVASRRRRRLLQSSVEIVFIVESADDAGAGLVEDALLDLQASAELQTSFVDDMVASGATGVSAITVTAVTSDVAAADDDDGLIEECAAVEVTDFNPDDFFAEVLNDETNAYEVLSTRKCGLWLTKATQWLTVEFGLYNGELGVLGVVTLQILFERGGGVSTEYSVSSVRANPYDDDTAKVYDGFFLTGVVVLGLKLAYDLVLAVRKRTVHKYLHQFWNLVDFGVLILSMVVAVHWSDVAEEASSIDLSAYSDSETSFSNVEDIQELSLLITELVAMSDENWELRFECMLLTLLVAFRLFKYFRFQPRLALLTDTLKVALSDLAHLLILLILVIFSFVVGGHVLFGAQMESFSTLGLSTLTSLNILLGEFDFDGMFAIAPLGATIFFWTFIVVVFFILFNMLLAIIMDAYAEVKEMMGSSEGIGADLASLAAEVRSKAVSMRCGKHTKEKYMTVVEGTQRLLSELRKGKLKGKEKVTTEEVAAALGVDSRQAVRLMRRNSLYHAVDIVKEDSDSDSDDEIEVRDVLRAVKTLGKRLDRVSDIVERMAGKEITDAVLPADRRVTNMFAAANVANAASSPKFAQAFKKGGGTRVAPGPAPAEEEGEVVVPGAAPAPAPAAVPEPSITA